MYNLKDFSYGFVIISPEGNYGRILTTVRSIRNVYGNVPICCAVIKETTTNDLNQIEKLCPAVRGKSHFTSLINSGIKKGHKDWNVTIMEGAIVSKGMMTKYVHFTRSEKDILFPIVPDYDFDGYPIRLNNTFYSCSLNGIMIHQKTFKEIGNLSDNPMEISRVMWALDAIRKGCQFKAILGIKF